MNAAAAIDTAVCGLGYELVGVERAPRGLLRVTIDHPASPVVRFITVDDCEKVTRQLQHVLEVEGVAYERLEVSSPGLDRPLRKAADYARFAGEEAKLTLREPIDNTRKLKGILRGVEGGAALVETARGMQSVPLDAIERARLVPRIEWRRT